MVSLYGAVFVFQVSPSILALDSAVAGCLSPALDASPWAMSSEILPEPSPVLRASLETRSELPGGCSGSGRLATRSSMIF